MHNKGDHDLSPWEIDPIAEEMDHYRSYKSAINISNPSNGWLDRGIIEEENMEGKIFMSCCKKIVFNIADFLMVYKQQKGHVCAATFENKASNLHIHSMCGSIDVFLHPWINGRELSHWMKRGAPVEFHRDIFGMKTLRGKFFYFCNNSFVVTDIVLTCEQQQRLILQLLYTSHIHAHEVHSNLHVLKEFEVKQYEDQTLAWFLRD